MVVWSSWATFLRRWLSSKKPVFHATSPTVRFVVRKSSAARLRRSEAKYLAGPQPKASLKARSSVLGEVALHVVHDAAEAPVRPRGRDDVGRLAREQDHDGREERPEEQRAAGAGLPTLAHHRLEQRARLLEGLGGQARRDAGIRMVVQAVRRRVDEVDEREAAQREHRDRDLRVVEQVVELRVRGRPRVRVALARMEHEEVAPREARRLAADLVLDPALRHDHELRELVVMHGDGLAAARHPAHDDRELVLAEVEREGECLGRFVFHGRRRCTGVIGMA